MCSLGTAGACFTDVVLHSLKNYRNERAREPRRYRWEFVVVRGPVFLGFHEISSQYKTR